MTNPGGSVFVSDVVRNCLCQRAKGGTSSVTTAPCYLTNSYTGQDSCIGADVDPRCDPHKFDFEVYLDDSVR